MKYILSDFYEFVLSLGTFNFEPMNITIEYGVLVCVIANHDNMSV